MEAWAAEGGYRATVYQETKSGEGYRKLVEYGDGCLLNAGILWTKKRVRAVLWAVRCSTNDADEVPASVQRVLGRAQEGHK